VVTYCAKETVTAKGKSLRTILLMTLDADELAYHNTQRIITLKALLKPLFWPILSGVVMTSFYLV